MMRKVRFNPMRPEQRAYLDTTTNKRGSAKRNAAFTLQDGAMLTPRQPEGCVPVAVSRRARCRLIGHIVLDDQTHSQRQQRERNRECEGLQADGSEAGGTECSACGETYNNRPRVLCPPARLAYVAGLTPKQSVAKIHDETSDVGCHHRCS